MLRQAAGGRIDYCCRLHERKKLTLTLEHGATTRKGTRFEPFQPPLPPNRSLAIPIGPAGTCLRITSLLHLPPFTGMACHAACYAWPAVILTVPGRRMRARRKLSPLERNVLPCSPLALQRRNTGLTNLRTKPAVLHHRRSLGAGSRWAQGYIA